MRLLGSAALRAAAMLQRYDRRVRLIGRQRDRNAAALHPGNDRPTDVHFREILAGVRRRFGLTGVQLIRKSQRQPPQSMTVVHRGAIRTRRHGQEVTAVEMRRGRTRSDFHWAATPLPTRR